MFFDRIAGIVLAALLLTGLPAEVCADRNLRCGNRIVSVGDPQNEILERCGPPDDRHQWEEARNGWVSRLFDPETESYRAPRLTEGPIVMERWTYDFGPHMFIRHLLFENGTLIEIETAEKGTP